MKKLFLIAALLCAPALACAEMPHGTGKVIRADAAAHTITLKHAPIPALGWGEMTMAFEVAPTIDLSTLKPGDTVAFTLKPEGEDDYSISAITKK